MGGRIKASFETVSEAVREAVAQEHGTEVSTVVLLPPAHLSKTSSGKVQRRAIRRAYLAEVLPLLFESSCGQGLASAEGFVAPRGDTEARLAEIWSDLFDGRAVGVRDSFFHLGGDSVVAAQLTARVRSVFEVEMSIENVFEAPTVEEQARWLEVAQKGNEPLPLGPASTDSEGEPSLGQERLWFHSQLEPLSPAYNLPLALRLRGQVARRALATAWQTVVHRHSPLRSRIVKVDGRPRVVVDSPAPVALPVVDLSALSRDSRRSQSEALLRQEGLMPFDLATGPLARATLLDVGGGEHLFLLDLHHKLRRWLVHGHLAARDLDALQRLFGTRGISTRTKRGFGSSASELCRLRRLATAAPPGRGRTSRPGVLVPTAGRCSGPLGIAGGWSPVPPESLPGRADNPHSGGWE